MINQRYVVACAIVACCIVPATAAQPPASSPAGAPAGPVSVAIIEPEVLADMPADQRKALAGAIDTVLTESLSKQKGFVLVDRQALDKVLQEKALAAGAVKVNAQDVAEGLRAFWAAGVLVCSRVDAKNRSLVIEAVSAQTGQLLATLYAKDAASPEAVAKFLAVKSEAFWRDTAEAAGRARCKPLLEISGKLTGSLTRLAWMVDDFTDAAGARVDAGGKAIWLVPRQPLFTKEERLLRVMGLAQARPGDVAAGLSPLPQVRLTFELADSAKTGVAFEKTPISLKLSFRRGQDKPVETRIDGEAGQWEACREKAVQWAISELSGPAGAATAPAADEAQRARQLAREELAAARQMVADAGNRYDWYSYGTPRDVLAQIARRALRAAHLDPASEEAARYVALTCDDLYPTSGDNSPNRVAIDRVITECQRYLDRFRQTPKPYNPTFQVMEKCARAALYGYWPLVRGNRNRYAGPPDDELYRYTKADVDNTIPLYCAWVAEQGTDNIWAASNMLRDEVFSNCPLDKLEQERDRWREFWKTTVDKIKHASPPPPFQFVEVGYYVRKKDCESVRRLYSELAAKFPKLDNHAWSTRIPCSEALWKEQLTLTLRAAGDPQWQTWEPSFGQPAGEVFYPKLDQWDAFFFRLNPAPPNLWAGSSKFVGSLLTFPQAVLQSGGRGGGISALRIAGEDMIFITPGIDNNGGDPAVPHTLFAAPLSKLTGREATLAVEPVKIEWPTYPAADGDRLPAIRAQCSLVTSGDDGTTLWIGTTAHGIARFDRRDGKWVGRWFTDRDGLPAKSVCWMTTCIHEGKPAILALGSGAIKDSQGQTNTMLWAMNEATGSSVLLGDSRKDANIARGMILRWPTGEMAPLELYSRALLSDLDIKSAKFAPRPEPWYEPVGGCDPKRPWGTDRERIAPVDPKTFAFRDGPLKGGIGATPYYDEQTYFIAMIPTHAMRWVDMPGQAPVYPIDVAAMTGEWLWLGLNGTRCAGQTPTLSAYRPTPGGKDWADNDLWVPPLAMPGGGYVRGILSDGTHLWVATTSATICRIDCAAFVEAAAGSAISTSQWQRQFQDRLAKANWRSQVQFLLGQRKFDEVVALTTERMAKADQSKPDHLKEWTDAALWQAVALARAPRRQDKAIELYVQLSDDKRLEPTARAFALINLIKVSYVAGRWQQVLDTSDKLFRVFPEFKSDGQTEAMSWYLTDARKKLAASQPASRPTSSSTRTAIAQAR